MLPLQQNAANSADLEAFKSTSTGAYRTPQEAMRLEALLRSVEDLTHLSAELLSKAIEQGCWYHVNPFRSSLIRALDLPGAARILEVGCGGGALTRYLGEQGYDVVALEISEELAECARLRCRDLSNVKIVTGFVENVLVDQRFDFVVCVDPLFVESDFFDPGLHLMTLCKKVLKLRDMLDELKRRYVASEEWGKSLSQRVSDAETELEQARSWWLYRFVNRFRGALHRRNNTLRKIGKNSVDSPAL
jgi:SAM-dependent methyltransferase